MQEILFTFWSEGGGFVLLGIWGCILAVLRYRIWKEICREAARGGGEKGRLLRAMTLKFEKSYEVHVEISDRDMFVQKYLCQEKRYGIPLPRWKNLPERWAGLILCVGAVVIVLMERTGSGQTLAWQQGTAALGAAAVVAGMALLLDADSLWEQAYVLLLDYVSNTLYPRQIHVYEQFAEETDGKVTAGMTETEKKTAKTSTPETGKTSRQVNEAVVPVVLKQEEEKLFQEVLADFLG